VKIDMVFCFIILFCCVGVVWLYFGLCVDIRGRVKLLLLYILLLVGGLVELLLRVLCQGRCERVLSCVDCWCCLFRSLCLTDFYNVLRPWVLLLWLFVCLSYDLYIYYH